MKKTMQLLALLVFAASLTLLPAFGQKGFDDSELRKNAAERIARDHGINFDWQKSSLFELTYAEARLNAVKRIKRDYGVTFDWQKYSLLELTDSEARMNTAKRIATATNKPIDWKKYSLEDLLRMESNLSGVPPHLGEAKDDTKLSSLSFDQIFPSESQGSMGLNKLTPAEKEALRKHVESLVLVAVQAGAQQPNPQGSVIESKIAGDFEGWEGETIVKLMNGQIWQQTEYYYHYHYAFMPDVLIYNSGGGWKMKVEGADKSVKVERLK